MITTNIFLTSIEQKAMFKLSKYFNFDDIDFNQLLVDANAELNNVIGYPEDDEGKKQKQKFYALFLDAFKIKINDRFLNQVDFDLYHKSKEDIVANHIFNIPCSVNFANCYICNEYNDDNSKYLLPLSVAIYSSNSSVFLMRDSEIRQLTQLQINHYVLCGSCQRFLREFDERLSIDLTEPIFDSSDF